VVSNLSFDYVARKITRAKWTPPLIANSSNAIRADAITACLRTHRDTLSLWTCVDNSKDGAREPVLALASMFERIDSLEVVILDRSLLEGEGFHFEETKSDTPVVSLKQRHLDLVNLTSNSLVRFAEILCPIIREKYGIGDTYTFTKKEVRKILADAVLAGQITQNDLQDKVREEIEKVL
jgi:hypothetical protein